MVYRIVSILICLALLTGCSFGVNKTAIQEQQDTGKVIGTSASIGAAEASSNSTESKSVENEKADGMDADLSSFWDAYAVQYEGISPSSIHRPDEPDFLPVFLAGLKHEKPMVRWYAANRIIEFFDHSRKAEVIKLLEKLSDDQVDYVRKAAEFTISIMKKEFKGEPFIKAPDGKNAAFIRFGDTQYNDGQVWVYFTEIDTILKFADVGGGANGLHWSPDGGKLCIGSFGRIWSDVTIYETKVDGRQRRKWSPNVFDYISRHKKELGYKTGNNQRPDPYITFLEWSPDGKRLLLFYQFTDDEYVVQRGVVVYNCTSESIDKIIKYEPFDGDHPPIEKPKNFNW